MKYNNLIISVRFQVSDVDLLKKVANSRGENVSDFVRLSVKKEFARLSFLSDEEKKALEVTNEVNNEPKGNIRRWMD